MARRWVVLGKGYDFPEVYLWPVGVFDTQAEALGWVDRLNLMARDLRVSRSVICNVPPDILPQVLNLARPVLAKMDVSLHLAGGGIEYVAYSTFTNPALGMATADEVARAIGQIGSLLNSPRFLVLPPRRP